MQSFLDQDEVPDWLISLFFAKTEAIEEVKAKRMELEEGTETLSLHELHYPFSYVNSDDVDKVKNRPWVDIQLPKDKEP